MFNKEDADAKMEVCFARRIMEQAGEEWAKAGCVELDGKLIAIALAEVCGDTLVCHVEKALPQYEGVVHGGIGVALHQPFPLRFRHHAEGGRRAVFHAPGVDLVQGGVRVPLVRQGNGEVEHGPMVGAVVEDHQTPVGFGKLRMPVVPPHELDAEGVLAQAVGALAVVFA